MCGDVAAMAAMMNVISRFQKTAKSQIKSCQSHQNVQRVKPRKFSLQRAFSLVPSLVVSYNFPQKMSCRIGSDTNDGYDCLYIIAKSLNNQKHVC